MALVKELNQIKVPFLYWWRTCGGLGLILGTLCVTKFLYNKWKVY